MPIIAPTDPRFPPTFALVEAARQNDAPLVQRWLDRGACADGLIYERFNALMYAAEHGNLAMGQALIAAGAVGHDPSMLRAQSAVYRAVLFKQDAFALWLLDQPDPSFDPNRRSADGWTVLHLLGLREDVPLPVLDRLLELGADPALLTPRVLHRDGPEDLDGRFDELPRNALSIARGFEVHAMVARLEQWALQHEPVDPLATALPDPLAPRDSRARL